MSSTAFSSLPPSLHLVVNGVCVFYCFPVKSERIDINMFIERIQNYLDDQGIVTAYKAFVRSRLEYGNLVYWGAAESNLKKLDSIQDSTKSMLRNKNHFLPDLEDRRNAAALGLTCKLMGW